MTADMIINAVERAIITLSNDLDAKTNGRSTYEPTNKTIALLGASLALVELRKALVDIVNEELPQ